MKSLNQNKQTSAIANSGLENFVKVRSNDLQVKTENLIAEFRERKNELIEKNKGFVKEYELFTGIAQINSGKATPDIILRTEEMMMDNWKSITLKEWSDEIGFNKMVTLCCELFTYMLSSFKTKEKTEGMDLMKLVIKIFAQNKYITVRELITILDNGRKGTYGQSFSRIDEETIFGWYSKFMQHKYNELETEMINKKPEQSNIGKIVNPEHEELRVYEIMQKRKKEIRDGIN